MATVSIQLLAETRGFNKGLGDAESRLGKMGGVAKTAGKAVGIGLLGAGAAALAFGAQTVKSASDAQQSLGATQTVFGRYAKEVIARSNDAAKAVGLSANEYRELSNVVGASLSGAGVPLEKAAGLTDKLNVRAADLAATFGGKTSEAVAAFSSLLRGEADPIERYGISVKQSDVNARLAAKGLDGLTGSAKKQAEMQARLDLAFQQSSKSQGAFKREGNTLANQQQVLGAQFENLKASLGTALLPVLTKVLTVINTQFTPAVKAIGEFLAPVIARVKEFFAGLGGGTGPMTQVMGVFRTLGTTITQTIIPAVTTVAQYLAGKLFPVFQQVSGIIQGRVIPIFAAVATFMYGRLLPAVVAIATKVGSNLKPVFDQLVSTFQSKVLPAINKLLAKFQEYGPTIGKVVSAVVKVAGTVLEFASAIAGKVLPVAIRFAGFLAGGLISAIGTAIGIVVKIAGAIVDFGAKVVDGGRKIGEFAVKVANKIGDVIGYVKELPGKIVSALGDTAKTLYSAGSKIIQGLLDGINAKFDSVKSKLNELTNLIPDWKGPAGKDAVLLKPAGKSIIEGLIKGFDEASAGVESYLEKLTNRIAKATDKAYKNDKKAARQAKDRIASIADEAKALITQANAYDRLNARLTEQTSILADLKTAAADYAAGIASSIVAFGNLATLGGRKDAEGNDLALTAGNVIADLQVKVNEANEFASLIQSLTAQGLDKTSIQQLIDAGVDGGLATARALAAGGPAAIAQVSALQAQLQATGVALGNSVSATMHDSGIQIQQGVVNGLLADVGAAEDAMEKLAKKLVRAFRKALKIKSPSRVFAALGEQVTAGIEVGLGNTAGVERATVRIAEAMTDAFTPTLNASAGGSSSSGNVYQINVTTDTFTDQTALANKIAGAVNQSERNGYRRLAIG